MLFFREISSLSSLHEYAILCLPHVCSHSASGKNLVYKIANYINI